MCFCKFLEPMGFVRFQKAIGTNQSTTNLCIGFWVIDLLLLKQLLKQAKRYRILDHP